MQDLAIKTLEELWFSQPLTNLSKNNENLAQVERNQLLARVSVIMGVCGNFKDRQSPLEDMLSKIVAGKEGADVSALHDRYAELCDAMIDGLVDASDFMNFVSLDATIRFNHYNFSLDRRQLHSNYTFIRRSLSSYHIRN